MRHSRSEQFEAALTAPSSAHRRWTEDDLDPNAAAALARRALTLRAAWRPQVPDRVLFLIERCRGRHVLDIGCVAHDVARMSSPSWLHGRLAAVAASCVGVDILQEGVDEMLRLGHRAIVHDLSSGIGPLADEAPFDVIVAGELVEHVGSNHMLFEVAAQLLADDGELIITTPNPWAPSRVRAGRLGHVWENVDHVVFAFPSGVAELAERHGLVLAEARTTANQRERSVILWLKAVRRRMGGRQWMNVGFRTVGEPAVVRISDSWLSRSLTRVWPPFRAQSGETSIYVVRRPTGHSSAVVSAAID
jgi:2-polyprenyl-3-methyl-5-hydroxy-6-metoxy-1,4-benzoquinol methylase